MCIMKEVCAEFLIQKQASNHLFVCSRKSKHPLTSSDLKHLRLANRTRLLFPYEIKYFPSFFFFFEIKNLPPFFFFFNKEGLSIQFKNCTLSITVKMKLTGYELEFGHVVKEVYAELLITSSQATHY